MIYIYTLNNLNIHIDSYIYIYAYSTQQLWDIALWLVVAEA